MPKILKSVLAFPRALEEPCNRKMRLNTVFQCSGFAVLYSHPFSKLNNFCGREMRIIAEREMKGCGNLGLWEGSEKHISLMAEPS